MGVWKLVIEICLPIPLTLIIALLCPAPRQVVPFPWWTLLVRCSYHGLHTSRCHHSVSHAAGTSATVFLRWWT